MNIERYESDKQLDMKWLLFSTALIDKWNYVRFFSFSKEIPKYEFRDCQKSNLEVISFKLQLAAQSDKSETKCDQLFE